jgi:hypothetical protein
LEDLDADWKMILKFKINILVGSLSNGLILAQDRHQCPALVNMAMNLDFYKRPGISGLIERLFASEEGLCY